MPVLVLLAGLVLLFAGSSWFTGATTVGVILTVFGGIFTLLPLLAFILVAAGIKSTHDDLKRNPSRFR